MVCRLPRHHLYACEEGAFELTKHISFREYLKAHPDEAVKLSDLKRKLAWGDGLSRAEYIEAKSEYVGLVAQRALEWLDGRNG